VTRDDGRRVEVRINDRGPFGEARRIIDVSRRAAVELGMIKAGVIDVQLEVLHVPERKAPRKPKRRR
jgi:rare lipoprotein A